MIDVPNTRSTLSVKFDFEVVLRNGQLFAN
jgi:hypothetical protein